MRFEVSRVLDAIEQRLTTDARFAGAVVDLASVARYAELDRGRSVNLLRLGMVVDALGRQVRHAGVLVYPVAERSLMSDNELTSNEKMVLRRWSDDGLLEVLPALDDRVLEIADLTGLPVISRAELGRYTDRYPWLVQDPRRVLIPVPGAGGPVLMTRAGTAGPGPTVAGRNLPGRVLHCPDPVCPSFGPRVEQVSVPSLRTGRPTCPRHGAPLTDAGPRTPSLVLVVRIAGGAGTRFTVAAGRPVAVGRSPEGPDSVALRPWLDEQSAPWVSRSHVLLELDDGALTVTDTSTNGTVVVTGDGERRGLGRGRRHTLGPWDVVELHTGVEICRADAAHRPASGPLMDDAPTVAIRRPPT